MKPAPLLATLLLTVSTNHAYNKYNNDAVVATNQVTNNNNNNTNNTASIVDVSFGVDNVTCCAGQTLRVTWTGYHDLVEMKGWNCYSGYTISIPEKREITQFENSGYVEEYTDLCPTEGSTRYFRCSDHCNNDVNGGIGNAKFSVNCPCESGDCGIDDGSSPGQEVLPFWGVMVGVVIGSSTVLSLS